MVQHIALTLARFCSAAWVGAATLFVLTSVTEQRYDGFDAETKAMLALLRFPWFYGFGCGLQLATLLLACLVRRQLTTGRAITIATGFAIVLTAIDYCLVYRPLRALLRTATPHGSRFDALHFWSEGINSLTFLTMLAVAFGLSWPDRLSSKPPV